MKPWLVLLFSLFLAACVATGPRARSPLLTLVAPFSISPPSETPSLTTTTEPAMNSAYPDLGPAPELYGDIWLNSEAPLHLKNLHGKVVLVDMWTFG